MPWIKDQVKFLGISIVKNKVKMVHDNYYGMIKEIEDCLKVWKMRSLSLLGKIQVIKSLACSKLIYNFSVINNPPEEFFKQVETVFYRFLWNSKTE